MPYVDPQTIDNPTTGQPIPAAWGDAVRDALEFFAEPPQCSVSGSAVSSTSGNETILTAGSEAYDTDTMHSTASNTSRITCNTAGKFLFWRSVSFAANGTGYRRINYKLNGGSAVTILTVDAVATAGVPNTVLSFTFSVPLAVNDYVEISAHQLSGGPLDITLREFGAVWQSR